MNPITCLDPYVENLSDRPVPPISTGPITEFPLWLASGIYPQQFWIPHHKKEVIIQLSPDRAFPSFSNFVRRALEISERGKMTFRLDFNGKDYTPIEMDKEAQAHTKIEKFIYAREQGMIRQKYVENFFLVQKVQEAFFDSISKVKLDLFDFEKEEKAEVQNFKKQLQTVVTKVREREVSAIVAAAWAFREIVRLRPFEKQNNQIGKLFASAVLQMGRHQAIFFPDQEKLKVALRADLAEPGSLASYLEKVVKWNQAQLGLKTAMKRDFFI